MFVLLFGLMGVAAIFPVGNHYIVEGEKFDLGSAIAQNAFEELGARGMLRPRAWLYPTEFPAMFFPAGEFIRSASRTFTNDPAPPMTPPPGSSDGPGNAIIIDPLGSSVAMASFSEAINKINFPFDARFVNNPWVNGTGGYSGTSLMIRNGAGALYSPGAWPVKRVTLPIPDPASTTGASIMMTPEVAETIFRLRDDLAVEQPEENDRPSIQRWDVDNSTTTPTLLRRQYKGDYSWLATIVPTTGEALAALQPAHEAYGEIHYDVSVVVFRKRDTTPSVDSERLIEAELLQGGELVIYSSDTDATMARQQVDDAVDDIRPGNWISLMGVNQTTGDFIMKWYRILSLDDETDTLTTPGAGTVVGRRAMLIGPDWPATPDPVMPGQFLNYIGDLRAAILPGAFLVVTKQLKMEDSSLWSLE